MRVTARWLASWPEVVAAHAVGQDVEAEVGDEEEVIFVLGALEADICAGCAGEVMAACSIRGGR